MFLWNSIAFSMIQQMLAIRSLVPLPFLKPPWTSGSSRFMYCWSLAWRILSITLLACEMSAIVGSLNILWHCLSLGLEWKLTFSSPVATAEFSKFASAAKSLQSCPTLCDPRDGSPPGSAVLGILQARTLEWVAISFSNAWNWKAKVKSLSRARLLATPWTAAFQAPLSVGFSRQEYWSRVLYTLVIPVLQNQVGEFPGGSGCKEFACNAGNLVLTPG